MQYGQIQTSEPGIDGLSEFTERVPRAYHRDAPRWWVTGDISPASRATLTVI